MAGKRVFVVDDNTIVLRFVELHLGQAGYVVKTTSNPLTVAMEVGGFRPDLVLLDVEMPTIRGTDVLAALRRSSCHGEVKIVLFSSLADHVLQQLAGEFGAAGFIRKASPLNGPELVSRVRALLGAAAEDRPVAFVADDSRAMRRILTGSLTSQGFDVTMAANGLELLGALEKTDRVDLVLMDINMPEMNGLEVVQKIRTLGAAARARVVLVTCESDLNHVRRLVAAGADDYLLKPFTRQELTDKVRANVAGIQRALG
jgi:two-component system chemotaxis response regulator CheY